MLLKLPDPSTALDLYAKVQGRVGPTKGFLHAWMLCGIGSESWGRSNGESSSQSGVEHRQVDSTQRSSKDLSQLTAFAGGRDDLVCMLAGPR